MLIVILTKTYNNFIIHYWIVANQNKIRKLRNILKIFQMHSYFIQKFLKENCNDTQGGNK